MKTTELNPRSIFRLIVAAAITGENPWACGYGEYRGTFRSLKERLPAIRRDHGGNCVYQWYHRGRLVSTDRIPLELEIHCNPVA